MFIYCRRNLFLSAFWRMRFFGRCRIETCHTCSSQNMIEGWENTRIVCNLHAQFPPLSFILNVCNLSQKLHTVHSSVGIIVTNVGVCMSTERMFQWGRHVRQTSYILCVLMQQRTSVFSLAQQRSCPSETRRTYVSLLEANTYENSLQRRHK